MSDLHLRGHLNKKSFVVKFGQNKFTWKKSHQINSLFVCTVDWFVNFMTHLYKDDSLRFFFFLDSWEF